MGPGMPTARDRVWRAALDVGMDSDTFTVDDVVGELGSDGPSRKTVQRTLRGMTELDVLEHSIGSPRYTCVWSAVDEAEPAPDPGPPEKSFQEYVEEMEPPGLDPEAVDARHRALLIVVEELRHGPRDKSELLAAVDAEVGAAHYDDLESLWKNWLFQALSKLEEIGPVESPGQSRRGWRLEN